MMMMMVMAMLLVCGKMKDECLRGDDILWMNGTRTHFSLGVGSELEATIQMMKDGRYNGGRLTRCPHVQCALSLVGDGEPPKRTR